MKMGKTLNYELIAVELGDIIKWTHSVNQIERVAQATLKVNKREFVNPNITSIRAQSVYDWVMSLAKSTLSEEEKTRRLRQFIEALSLEEKAHARIINFLRPIEIVPSAPPDFDLITQDSALTEILTSRWWEIQKCLNSEAYLSAIILMGSLLEGVLLAVVHKNPKQANQANASPKNEHGKAEPFHKWSLNDLIAVSHECGWIEQDVKDFSIVLRDYRNMVHPWHQRAKGFHPDKDTARICWEVVNAALNDFVKRATGSKK
jgi:hypothetical protein